MYVDIPQIKAMIMRIKSIQERFVDRPFSYAKHVMIMTLQKDITTMIQIVKRDMLVSSFHPMEVILAGWRIPL
jgi:23S rRNA maturation-related 3'-5' exoribonuclease YhaM